MISDADIMARIQAGENDLFASLVERYQPRLHRFATSKLKSPQAAEELVQETFLAVYKARDSYSSRFAFSTWIWTILLNLSRREFRRRQQRSEFENNASNPDWAVTGMGESPLGLLLQAERHELIREWLTELPENEADAIRLRFFGGLKFEEIAAAMESSLGAAKNRVMRGLERLAERQRQEEG